jgi:hypothetical protein
MRSAFIASALCLLTGLPHAQPWQLDMKASLSGQHTFHSENWEGDPQDALTWKAKLDAGAKKNIVWKIDNTNTIALSFGQSALKKKDGNWSPPRKSLDIIDIESMYNLTLGTWVDPYVALRAQSQFVDERDSTTPYYINPVDLSESAGITRDLVKENDMTLNLRFGAAVHQRIDRNTDTTMADITQAEIVVHDAGSEVHARFDISRESGLVDYATHLRIYEALVQSGQSSDGSSDIADWRYPRIEWDHTLSINFASYLMVEVSALLRYDKVVHENVRFQEGVSLGVTYSYSSGAREEKE